MLFQYGYHFSKHFFKCSCFCFSFIVIKSAIKFTIILIFKGTVQQCYAYSYSCETDLQNFFIWQTGLCTPLAAAPPTPVSGNHYSTLHFYQLNYFRYTSYRWRHTAFVFLCVCGWLVSLSIMSSRFFRVVSQNILEFLLWN